MHYPNAAIDRAQSYKEFLSPALARTKKTVFTAFFLQKALSLHQKCVILHRISADSLPVEASQEMCHMGKCCAACSFQTLQGLTAAKVESRSGATQ